MFKFIPLLLVSGLSFAATPSLQVAKDVPNEQKLLLQGDLKQLPGKSLRVEDPEFNKVLDVKGAPTGDSLLAWLYERVRYVIGEDYDLEQGIYVEKRRYEYQNPGLNPDIGKKSKEPDGKPDESGKKVVTIMSNMGSAIYLHGKKSNVLLGLKIPGVGKVPISSPRVGVIQVGQGLFKTAKGIDVNDIDASLNRLAVLFHEARHSDGNGKTLVMIHVVCPKGHDFEGYAACDFSLNGSYSVGAQVGKVLTENCTKCSVAQKERLRLNYVDSFSRVIKEKSVGGGSELGAGANQTLKETCEVLRKYGVEQPEYCFGAGLPESSAKIIKATYLDSNPEGTIEKRRRFFNF